MKLTKSHTDIVMIYKSTEGLSPQMVHRVINLIKEIANRGIATLLVERRLAIAMNIGHRDYVMAHGQIVFEVTPKELHAHDDVSKERLEV